jgi:hypothetical protein
MAFDFKSKEQKPAPSHTASHAPAPKSSNFDFGNRASKEPAKNFEEMERKHCSKCNRPMSTGAVTRWVCLYDGNTAS